MSDDGGIDQPQDSESAEDEDTRVPDASGDDPLLRALIGFVDSKPGNKLTMTFVVGGYVISGMVISAEAYAERTRDLLTDAAGLSADGGGFATAFQAYLEQRIEAREAGDLNPVPSFVHLAEYEIEGRDQGMAHGGQTNSVMRLRVTSIDAWLFGRRAQN